MDVLESLIRFENENSHLDFKATQYQKAQHAALLKDVIAMANAVGDGERFIVTGVKQMPNGERTFVGVPRGEFVDAATYQQLVSENVDPVLAIKYFARKVDGKTLGILRIPSSGDKPYMMKKDFGKALRKGDSFIRRGSTQDRLTRPDLDRIFQDKQETIRDFEILIGFEQPSNPTSISIPASEIGEFPSERARKKIGAILSEKRREAEIRASKPETGIPNLSTALARAQYLFGGLPYEHRTIEELENALQKVRDWYMDDDLFTVFEKSAAKINIRILNSSRSYIKDAFIELIFPELDELLVADRVYSEPQPRNSPMPEPDISHLLYQGYPEVEKVEGRIVARSSLGDLRHHVPAIAFGEPLRIVLPLSLEGRELSLVVRLHGENLPVPIERELSITVVPHPM